MGGFVGAELAIRRPERVAAARCRVAPRSSGSTGGARSRCCGSRGCPTRSWPRALTRATDDIATRRRLRNAALRQRRLPLSAPASPPELAHEMVRSARRTDGFLPALEALADYPLEEELPKIGCPTLIVWGAHDTLVPVKDADAAARS